MAKLIAIDKEVIKNKRLEKGFTQRTLAYLLNIDRNTIYKMECGWIKKINKDRYLKLVEVLGI